MKFKNYSDFVKSELKAVPVGIAQSQMGVGTVLVKKRFGGFVRAGNLTGLCANTGYQQMLEKELANVETLKHPFGKETTQEMIKGDYAGNDQRILECKVIRLFGCCGSCHRQVCGFVQLRCSLYVYSLRDHNSLPEG